MTLIEELFPRSETSRERVTQRALSYVDQAGRISERVETRSLRSVCGVIWGTAA